MSADERLFGDVVTNKANFEVIVFDEIKKRLGGPGPGCAGAQLSPLPPSLALRFL